MCIRQLIQGPSHPPSSSGPGHAVHDDDTVIFELGDNSQAHRVLIVFIDCLLVTVTFPLISFVA